MAYIKCQQCGEVCERKQRLGALELFICNECKGYVGDTTTVQDMIDKGIYEPDDSK